MHARCPVRSQRDRKPVRTPQGFLKVPAAVGRVSGAEQKGQYLDATVVIETEDEIAAVERGELREVGCQGSHA